MKKPIVVALVLLSCSFSPVETVSAMAAPKAITRVPVVVCATSSGAGQITPTPVPSSAHVPAADGALEVYTVEGVNFQVIAPRGLDCQGSVAADGGTDITVGSQLSSRQFVYSASVGRVWATEIPACYGCMLTLACPFFSAAERATKKAVGPKACPAQPVGQVIDRLSSDAVAFSDPAGEAVPKSDDLVPNDSPYPTNGVVLYYQSRTYQVKGGVRRFDGYYPTAMAAVCVLPAAKHQVCTRVLNEFLASRGKITS